MAEGQPCDAEMGSTGVRKAGAGSNGDSIHQPNGGQMLPGEVQPAPGEGVYSWLIIFKAGKIPCGSTVVEEEEAQELPMNPVCRGRMVSCTSFRLPMCFLQMWM